MTRSPRQRRRQGALLVGWLLVLGMAVGGEMWANRPSMPRQKKQAGWRFVRVEAQAVGVGTRRNDIAPVDTVRIDSGWIMAHEFRVRDYCRWLNTVQPQGGPDHPQVEWLGDRWIPGPGLADNPVGYIGSEEAARVCAWVGEQSGLGGVGRLPREAEWLVATRAGSPGVTYPWGFSPASVAHACFDEKAPRAVASYEPNGWGVYDGAGNVAEWCRDNVASDRVMLKGGSFSERDPSYLQLARRVFVAADYQDADAGFRVWVADLP